MSLIKTNNGLRSVGLLQRPFFADDFFSNELSDLFLDNAGVLSSKWIPAANIKENEKEFLVELSVPGYTKKDINVEVEDNSILKITGTNKNEVKEETDNYTRKEFSYGSFTRSFELPETINQDKVSAKCVDGMLTIELPKKETAILKKKTKEVKIA